MVFLWISYGFPMVYWGFTSIFGVPGASPGDVDLVVLFSTEQNHVQSFATYRFSFAIGGKLLWQMVSALTYSTFHRKNSVISRWGSWFSAVSRWGKPQEVLQLLDRLKTRQAMGHGSLAQTNRGLVQPSYKWNKWSGITVGNIRQFQSTHNWVLAISIHL